MTTQLRSTFFCYNFLQGNESGVRNESAVHPRSTNSATTASFVNEISLSETADVRADDGIVDDRLTSSSSSSSSDSSTATTDTEDGGDGVIEGRKRKKEGDNGSSDRADSVKDVEEMDGEGLLLAEAAAPSGSDKDNDALCETKDESELANQMTASAGGEEAKKTD
uniref:Uncharacterized protein n=1 Tax=Globodera rostochiensis TaxID=31243 RepID=A0A914GZ80_GLORO